MTDRFADVESPRPRLFQGVLAAMFLVGVFLLFHLSNSEPRRVTGVVASTGPISTGKVRGGTREEAYVRLEDGTHVFAYVVSGGPLSEGDQVFLLEQYRLLGGPVYQVVGKQERLNPR